METNVIAFLYKNMNSFAPFKCFNGTFEEQMNKAIDYCDFVLPTYTDRSHFFNITKKVINKNDIIDLINLIKDSIMLDYDQVRFNIHLKTKDIEIIFINKQHSVSPTNYRRRINYGRSTILIYNDGSAIARIPFENTDYLSLEQDGLTKSENTVLSYIKTNKKPVSRGDLAYETGYSDRAISYALSNLEKKRLIHNTNKKNSPKLNKYIIYKG